MRGLDEKSLADALQSLPALDPARVRNLAAQSSNLVFEADGMVYRFAVGDWTARRFAQEYKVLAALDGALPCPVPRITGAGTDPAYLAYPKIPGRSLRDVGFARLSTAQQDRLLDQVAAFLAALHGCSPDRFDAANTRYGWDVLDRSLPGRRHHLAAIDPSGTACAFAEETLDRVARIRPRLRTSVPLHQDLQDSNILVDGDGGLAGMLDFTLFWIGDHHWDFRHIRSFAGDGGLKRLADRYETRGGHPVALDIVMALERVALCNAILWAGPAKQWKIDNTIAAMRAWQPLAGDLAD